MRLLAVFGAVIAVLALVAAPFLVAIYFVLTKGGS